jgi:hypothetical protein
LCILIFTSLDNRREENSSELNGRKQYQNSICY